MPSPFSLVLCLTPHSLAGATLMKPWYFWRMCVKSPYLSDGQLVLISTRACLFMCKWFQPVKRNNTPDVSGGPNGSVWEQLFLQTDTCFAQRQNANVVHLCVIRYVDACSKETSRFYECTHIHLERSARHTDFSQLAWRCSRHGNRGECKHSHEGLEEPRCFLQVECHFDLKLTPYQTFKRRTVYMNPITLFYTLHVSPHFP